MSYNLIDEEKFDFVHGKLKVTKKANLKIIEELNCKFSQKKSLAINPSINTRPPRQRMTLFNNVMINDIPEEESEWDNNKSVID